MSATNSLGGPLHVAVIRPDSVTHHSPRAGVSHPGFIPPAFEVLAA